MIGYIRFKYGCLAFFSKKSISTGLTQLVVIHLIYTDVHERASGVPSDTAELNLTFKTRPVLERKYSETRLDFQY